MKPELGILSEQKTDDYTLLTIDTSKAKWQRIAWRDLSDFGKRKFENFIVLHRTRERLKFRYA